MGDLVYGDGYYTSGGKAALCSTYDDPVSYPETIYKIDRLGIVYLVGCRWLVVQGQQIQVFLPAEPTVCVQQSGMPVKGAIGLLANPDEGG